MMDGQKKDSLYFYFKKTIDAEVDKRVKALEEEIASLKQQAQVSIEKELKEEQDNIINIKKSDLEREYQLKLASYQRKLDLEVMNHRQKLLEEIFDRLINEINIFVASKDYEKWFKKRLSSYTLADYHKIAIDKSDKVAAKIIKDTNLELVLEDNLVGGFVIYSKDEKTLSDESLKNRISESHAWFYDNAAWFNEGE
jgi:vacuolar-type H+-ATPase subunit E/Vma4